MSTQVYWRATLLAIGVSMATLAIAQTTTPQDAIDATQPAATPKPDAATQAKARTEPTVQEATKSAPPASRTATMPPAASSVPNAAQVAAPQAAVVARETFGTLDKDKDGRVSSTEADADAGFSGSFAAMDTNGDGFVNDDEYRAHAKATAKPDEWTPTENP
jgi:hypothetical protein